MGTKDNFRVYEQAKKFIDDYEILILNFDSIHKKTFLDGKKYYCRFCNKSAPDVPFTKDAHVFPQFLTNKYLLSNYECDNCNELFSRTLENEMANFMKLFHTLYGVKGEKKIPTFKDERIRIESNGHHISINSLNNGLSNKNFKEKEFIINLTTEKFIPIAVYKCLTKMALSIIPEEHIHLFSRSFRWLQDDHHANREFKIKDPYIIYSQLEENYTFSNLSSILLKRKNNRMNKTPTFIFILRYSKFSFQIYLPLCDLDNYIDSVESFNYFPHYVDFIEGFDFCEKFLIDCSSTEKSEFPVTVTITDLDK